jgi:glycosyltransferase involved in cell wall biosynthesis
VTIGLTFGPPQQYASPDLDWAISATKHPLMDSPCSGSLVEIEVELADPREAAGYIRSDFGIADRAVIVLCAGRPEKFLNQEFWKALISVLLGHLEACLVVVGVPEEPRFLSDLLPADARNRFVRLGWRTDYLKILGLADILVDTFPSGGGVTLFDAMALGIPVVSFQNDYLRPYSQADWSPAEEWLEPSELLIGRGNLDQLELILSRLIEDPSYRTSMGEQCRETIVRNRGNPERMVRRHEQIYERVIAMTPSHTSASLTQAKRRVRLRPARSGPKHGRHPAILSLGRRAIQVLYFRLSRLWRVR